MPYGVIRFEIGKHPFDPSCHYPFFLIEPTNPQSAKIKGVIEGQEHRAGTISITIGQASTLELWVDLRRPDRAEAEIDEFLQICNAVFSTWFYEDVTFGRQGDIIRSRLLLDVAGKKIVFSSGVLFRNPFQKTTSKRFSYEPYVKTNST